MATGTPVPPRSDDSRTAEVRIGILSVQGAFAAHERVLRGMGATPVPVREPADLAGLAGLVLPGGESTAMQLLMKSNGLWDALGELVPHGRPTLATCAGSILLAGEILDGRPDQESLGVVDISVRRNGYGRQVDSFEADLALTTGGAPFPGVFIRAPVIERTGDGVEVLASVDRPTGPTPVLCRDRNVVLCTFHPELTGDSRVHALAFGGLLDRADLSAPVPRTGTGTARTDDGAPRSLLPVAPRPGANGPP
jgi:pyridoxal 5'-phosphate synthase pdxT subunit